MSSESDAVRRRRFRVALMRFYWGNCREMGFHVRRNFDSNPVAIGGTTIK